MRTPPPPRGVSRVAVVRKPGVALVVLDPVEVRDIFRPASSFEDTEVVAYLIDLLVRRHGLDIDIAVRALAPPFWEDIDRMPGAEQEWNTALRLAYAQAMMNGPFAIVAADAGTMVGFTDRSKLRPMVVGECGDRLYISSEEAAIRAMEPNVESIMMPAAGEPVIGRVAR